MNGADPRGIENAQSPMNQPVKRIAMYSKPSNRRDWLALFAVQLIAFLCWVVLSKEIQNIEVGSIPIRIDATISAWTERPFLNHWFMYFLSNDDVSHGVPYSNMPYFYTFFYAAYHYTINFVTFGKMPHASTYIFTMFALLAASWYILQPVLKGLSLDRGALILVLTLGMLVTSPYVVGYLLQFNHDTVFPLNAIAATVLAFAIWREDGRQRVVVWTALIYCSISGLLGLVTLASCYDCRRQLKLTNSGWNALFAFTVVGLLLPMVIAKLAFGQTSASTLMFRTGLDGSTQYFTDHWQALVGPVEPRSLSRALAVKVVTLGIFLLVARVRFGLGFGLELKALGVALLVYASHWVMFPQSISIHPYLYDMLFLIPLDLFCTVVFAVLLSRFKEISSDMGAVVVVATVIFMLQSNLIQLAQGRFIGV